MRIGRAGARFAIDAEGASAIEFSIVFPVLVLLMLAGIQLVVYVNAVRKVELVASSISEMISQAAPPNSQSVTATVNQLDLHFSYDSTIVIFPYLLKDAAQKGIAWWQDITIDYASIQFTQTSTACGTQQDQSPCYLANVVWTSTGTVGNNARPCVLPQLPTTSNTPNRTTLPANVFGPGSIVAIDVAYTFTPTFGGAFLGSYRIARSVYVQPRYATLINFDTTGNDGIATKCPGY